MAQQRLLFLEREAQCYQGITIFKVIGIHSKVSIPVLRNPDFHMRPGETVKSIGVSFYNLTDQTLGLFFCFVLFVSLYDFVCLLFVCF